MKRTSVKMILLVCAAIISVIFGVGIGSVYISPGDIFAILANHLFGVPLPETVSAVDSSMVMDLRLPRVLLAFCTGGASVSYTHLDVYKRQDIGFIQAIGG